MRRTLILLGLNTLLSLGAFAQDDLFDSDVFLGYSLFRANATQPLPAFNANGGIGTLAWNINNHIAIEAEFAAHYKGGSFDTTNFSYLFGPRLSYGRTKRIDPYVHVLLGGRHIITGVDASSVLIPTPHIAPAPSSGRYEASQDNFALALGGGIEIRVNRHIFFRPAQIDYIHTQFQTPTFLIAAPGVAPSTNNQNNMRYAVGFVIAFNDESVHQ